MGIVFHHLTGDKAKAVLGDDYVALYVATRAEPPYNSGPLYAPDRFLERTAAQTGRDGFELVAAKDGDKLVGFTFGFTFAAGIWWGGSANPPAAVIGHATLAVIELNVAAPHRGQGIGKQLLAELIVGRSEPYATLISDRQAPAHAMYLRWGWQIVGISQPAPDAPEMDVLLHTEGRLQA